MQDHGTLPPRFWSKVNKDGPIPEHCPELGPCWLWTAARDKDGYGFFGYGGKNVKPHRLIFECFRGPILEGHLVMHKCDNTSCVNPAHLTSGTQADNIADKVAKGRQARGDASPFRLHSESYPHGDDHYLRKNPELVKRGESHNMAKLTWNDVHAIRAAAEAGTRGSVLARKYGVSHGQIVRIVKRKSWIES